VLTRQAWLTAQLLYPEAADFLARMVLSYIGSPGRWDLTDPIEVAQLVRAELLAGIVPTSDESR
jgi:hypothetical protein